MKHWRYLKKCQSIRFFSSKPLLKVIPSESVLKDIETEVYKPKSHPGIIKSKNIQLPNAFIEAAEKATHDYPVKLLLTESENLARHLHFRVPPMEKPELSELKQKLLSNILKSESNVEKTTDKDEEQFKNKVNDKLKSLMRQKVYNWSPIEYNDYNALVYLFARSAPEYAVLVKIFSEIYNRDKNFKPRSFFDFGSGIGTGMWAANVFWNKQIYEYFNVDASSSMNDLSEILLKGGDGCGRMNLRSVFYRQFLPANNVSYDLVISAYSLMELPSFSSRIETIVNLWNKTDQYLIVVENGTNAGFKIINEVRDFLLHKQNENNPGYVFSPCPHDMGCPRFLAFDKTPCNFTVSYHTIPFGGSSKLKHELYSYIIFKKGIRDENEPKWPRVVRDTLIRSKHAICRMCTANAKLEEIIFTATKHGKTMYHCARSTKWGDRLPIEIKTEEKDH